MPDERRIAKNTIFLYVRMIVVMCVSLFTSREELRILGDVDFGIYNAVGSIVLSMTFLTSVLSSACNRYFSVEIGRGDRAALSKIFSLNTTIFLLMAVAAVLIGETVGVWFTTCKLVYPAERGVAVQLVLQLSLLTFVASMMTTPYRALIIAQEEMKVFAYSSLLEVTMKLGMVMGLMYSPIDTLEMYACGMLAINIGVLLFYKTYCNRHYEESRYRYTWDVAKIREVMSYTGWNVVGSMAVVGKSQGVALLLNTFFGPVVNAASAIAMRVSAVVNQFSFNFMTATSPQITKSYATGDIDGMVRLIIRSSKYSYFLMLLIALPISILMPELLAIWLEEVPDGTTAFATLLLMNALVDSLSMPTAYAMQATGRVKWYQLSVGGVLLLIVPIGYGVLYATGVSAEWVYVVSIATSVVAQAVRVAFVVRDIGMRASDYIQKVVMRITAVSVLSPVVPLIVMRETNHESWPVLVEIAVIGAVTAGWTVVVEWVTGMTGEERKGVKDFVRNKLRGHEGRKTDNRNEDS